MQKQDLEKQEQFPTILKRISFSFGRTSRRKRSMKGQAWILMIVGLFVVLSSGDVSAYPPDGYPVTGFEWSGFTQCVANVTVALPAGASINSVTVSGESPLPPDKKVWLKAGGISVDRSIPAGVTPWVSSASHQFDGTSYTTTIYTVTLTGFDARRRPGIEQVLPPHADCQPYETGNIRLKFAFTP